MKHHRFKGDPIDFCGKPGCEKPSDDPIHLVWPAPNAETVALAAAQEINELRERVVTLTAHSVTLNAVCWYLATELGILESGQKSITMPPMELAWQIVAQRDRFRDLAMRNQAGSEIAHYEENKNA